MKTEILISSEDGEMTLYRENLELKLSFYNRGKDSLHIINFGSDNNKLAMETANAIISHLE